ncbi:sodium:solute symporter, partial [Peribacillus sp. SIMBA_075]
MSPFVFPSIVLTGHGVTDGMGLSGAMLAVPVSFILLIVVSYITNRIPALSGKLTKQADIELIERIHGWKDIKAYRYNSTIGAGITVAV